MSEQSLEPTTKPATKETNSPDNDAAVVQIGYAPQVTIANVANSAENCKKTVVQNSAGGAMEEVKKAGSNKAADNCGKVEDSTAGTTITPESIKGSLPTIQTKTPRVGNESEVKAEMEAANKEGKTVKEVSSSSNNKADSDSEQEKNAPTIATELHHDNLSAPEVVVPSIKIAEAEVEKLQLAGSGEESMGAMEKSSDDNDGSNKADSKSEGKVANKTEKEKNHLVGRGTNGDCSQPTTTQIMDGLMRVLDCDIGYCRYGHGPNNFLFICGGVGCYKKDYPPNVLQAFDPSFATIVCIDPPGYGESRPPDRQQEVGRCRKDAKYCIELMQQLKLTPFAVLGWSEGGRTAVHVAGQGKQLVSHMVLFATATKVNFLGDAAFKGMRNTNQWLASAREPFLQYYSEEFLRIQWAALCDVVSQVYADLGGCFPSDGVLPQLKLPVLIVNGGLDRFVMDPKLIAKKLANCRIEIHGTGGHDLHIKYPKWFAMKLSTFVREQSPAIAIATATPASGAKTTLVVEENRSSKKQG